MAGAFASIVAKATNWAPAVLSSECKVILDEAVWDGSAGSFLAVHFVCVAEWVALVTIA